MFCPFCAKEQKIPQTNEKYLKFFNVKLRFPKITRLFRQILLSTFSQKKADFLPTFFPLKARKSDELEAQNFMKFSNQKTKNSLNLLCNLSFLLFMSFDEDVFRVVRTLVYFAAKMSPVDKLYLPVNCTIYN